ncbi:hypothetical protein C8T65DRAFT_26176 [Cerioporus squamosus]|nr:hypothetical protein C8T65DRAFT_26176 [Cerioporus squamosus]
MPGLPRVHGTSEDLYCEVCNLIAGRTLDAGAVQVCRHLGMPNTGTRSGLKDMALMLPEVSETLFSLFYIACTRKDWMYCDVVMIIWIEICADAVLCRTLLEEGLLVWVLPLVETGSSTTVLQLFSLLARHGDDTVRSEIVRSLPGIVARWKMRWSFDEYSVEFVLITLYHCIGVATLPATAPLALPSGLSVRFLAGITLEALEDVETSYETFIHAIPLLIICAKACPPQESETRDRILDLLAVLIHSKDPGLRCVCTWVFCDLAVADRDSLPIDASGPTSSSARHTTHFPALARRDASPGSEQESIQKQTQELRTLLHAMSKEENFYKFGVGMAQLLTNGPFPDRGVEDFKAISRAGRDSWYSLLPEAVEVLRRRQDKAHLDMADTLALEHFVREGSVAAAASHAREVFKRNAEHAYAYAILAEHSEDREEALQATTRGLRLAHLTVYLQRRLQVSAIELSFAKARRLLLQTAPPDWHRRAAAHKYVDAGMKHALAFIQDAPVDQRELARVLDLAIIHLMVLGGDCYTPKLERIKPLVQFINKSTRTREGLGYEVADSPVRVGHEALAFHFTQGYSKWAALVERFDEADEQHRAFNNSDPSAESESSSSSSSSGPSSGDDNHRDRDDEDKYASWWEPDNEPTLASLLRGPLRCSCLSSEDGCVQLCPGLALLYACSWCSCRTAKVRKCSRCQDAWYCDAQCQRAHWPQHKLVCRE